jgi:nucleoside 2-deoxyribosyltransferase
MRSHWQDKVIKALSNSWTVIDPRTHHLADEKAYTHWDLNGVRQSDWVLANLEVTNPGGYNLAVEIGFAEALGKYIILVDEKSEADEKVKRYTGMLRGCADLTPATLDGAIAFLQKLVGGSAW